MAWGTRNTVEIDKIKADIADLYGSEVLYFVYTDNRYVACYDDLDKVDMTGFNETSAIYEARNRESHRIC